MDRDKLKLIVRNLESLVNCLKVELESEDDSSYYTYDESNNLSLPMDDYDEIFYEDND